MTQSYSILLPSGNLWDFKDVWHNKFTISDIAQNLSRENRFNGGTDYPYSVAQHSVNVSKLVPDDQRMQALLHDKAEFAYKDVTTWLKRLCPDYRALLDEADDAMSDFLLIPRGMTPEIHSADLTMLALEKRMLFTKVPTGYHGFEHIQDIDTAGLEHFVHMEEMTHRQAMDLFMSRYEELSRDQDTLYSRVG